MADETSVRALAERARAASKVLARLSGEQRSRIVGGMAEGLRRSRDTIMEANARDRSRAEANGMKAPILDRLLLTDERFDDLVRSVLRLADLPDPIGEVMDDWKQPSGLHIRKVRVPIGVIAMIYEARPNVTVDAAALCLRSGNAVVLRGGSEARETNAALVKACLAGGADAGLPEGAIGIDLSGDHSAVQELVRLEGLIDLVIPRGGESLIRSVVEAARVPVIKHYKGVCHVYVDRAANVENALRIVVNAKCQRPGVCNAMETLLVDKPIAERFLMAVGPVLCGQGVELRGDALVREILRDINPASEEDWSAEYLALILSIKVVDGVEQAIQHIEKYGSHHSDAIVTENMDAAEKFLSEVDSAVVYLNASTRFTDGGEFGMGAELGISTDKLHARGPMGLLELTTYKYLVSGAGQIRQ